MELIETKRLMNAIIVIKIVQRARPRPIIARPAKMITLWLRQKREPAIA